MTPEEMNEILQGFADTVANYAPVREATAGYRAALINDHGFSAEAAEAMATQFHGHLMVILEKGMP